MDARYMALAGLILAGLAAPALAQSPPARERDARQLPTYGGPTQHYGDLRRAHRRATAALTVSPSVFQGAGGVGGQPSYAQTYVFYGVAYPHARAATGVAMGASARAVSQVQVRVDGH